MDLGAPLAPGPVAGEFLREVLAAAQRSPVVEVEFVIRRLRAVFAEYPGAVAPLKGYSDGGALVDIEIIWHAGLLLRCWEAVPLVAGAAPRFARQRRTILPGYAMNG
jgi:hypothetical protein